MYLQNSFPCKFESHSPLLEGTLLARHHIQSKTFVRFSPSNSHIHLYFAPALGIIEPLQGLCLHIGQSHVMAF